eukprot:4847633-Pyramimonas_sp.AAC.1
MSFLAAKLDKLRGRQGQGDFAAKVVNKGAKIGHGPAQPVQGHTQGRNRPSHFGPRVVLSLIHI